MKNYGKIPPHFLYILESEGVQISDMKSSNMALKESFDRMIVKIPYCNRTLDVQVIFDAINNSNPPDFVFTKEEYLLINYPEIIKDWNFKDSSTLHNCLLKLKNLYALAKDKRLREELEKNASQQNNNDDVLMRDGDNNKYNNYRDADDFGNAIPHLWKIIDKFFYAIKSKMSKYKNIDVNNFFGNCKTNSFGAGSNLNNSGFNSSFNASAKKQQNATQYANNGSAANNNLTPNNLNKNILENLNKKGPNNNLNFSSNKDNEEFNINEIPASHEAKNVSTVNHKNRALNQSNSMNNNHNNNNTNNSILNTPSGLNILNQSDYSINNNVYNNYINNNTLNSNFNNNNNFPLLEILPEISFSYNQKESSSFLVEYTEYKNSISIAYPLDMELRCRNIPRFPYVLVTIYLNYDMKFKLDLLAPIFINTSNFKNICAKNSSLFSLSSANEYFDLKNFEYIMEVYENSVLEYFRDMACRETIINKIINLNLGFTLEIDAAGFRKFSQYIHCNDKSNIKNRKFFDSNANTNTNSNSLKKGGQGSSSFSASPNPKAFPFYFNLIVCCSFDKEDAKVLQINIIDSDQLSNIATKKFNFTKDDLDNLINNVFEFLISNVNNKLNQAQ